MTIAMDHSGMNKSIIIMDSHIWYGTAAVDTQQSVPALLNVQQHPASLEPDVAATIML